MAVNLCKCNCGREIPVRNLRWRSKKEKVVEFLPGHHMRVQNHFKGKHHKNSSKRILSLLAQGRPSSFKGKKHKEETKTLISKMKLGKKMPEGTGKKMSESRTGSRNWIFGKHHSSSTLQKISNRMKGKPSAFKGKSHRPETIELIREKRKNQKSVNSKTSLELKVMDFLKNSGSQFEYVGDSKFWIGNLNPDFVNHEKKQVLEANGCYWHGCRKCFPNGGWRGIKDDSFSRVEKYKKLGWKSSFVWEHSIKEDGVEKAVTEAISNVH